MVGIIFHSISPSINTFVVYDFTPASPQYTCPMMLTHNDLSSFISERVRPFVPSAEILIFNATYSLLNFCTHFFVTLYIVEDVTCKK